MVRVNSSKCTIFTAIKFYSKTITDLEEICWDTTFHNQLKNIIKITILKTFRIFQSPFRDRIHLFAYRLNNKSLRWAFWENKYVSKLDEKLKCSNLWNWHLLDTFGRVYLRNRYKILPNSFWMSWKLSCRYMMASYFNIQFGFIFKICRFVDFKKKYPN